MKKVLLMSLMAMFCLTSVSAQKTVVAKKNQKVYEQKDDQKVFEIVEKMPEFPGGMEALFSFFSNNVHYPDDAKEQGVEGRVMVKFVVEKDGSLSGVEVVQKASPSLDAEAMRVVKAMPNWTPGKQRGRAVRVRFTIPVTFRLN